MLSNQKNKSNHLKTNRKMRFDHEKYQDKRLIPPPSITDSSQEEQFLARKNAQNQNQKQQQLILSIVLSISICIFLHAFVFSRIFAEDEIEKENRLLLTKGIIYQRNSNSRNVVKNHHERNSSSNNLLVSSSLKQQQQSITPRPPFSTFSFQHPIQSLQDLLLSRDFIPSLKGWSDLIILSPSEENAAKQNQKQVSSPPQSLKVLADLSQRNLFQCLGWMEVDSQTQNCKHRKPEWDQDCFAKIDPMSSPSSSASPSRHQKQQRLGYCACYDFKENAIHKIGKSCIDNTDDHQRKVDLSSSIFTCDAVCRGAEEKLEISEIISEGVSTMHPREKQELLQKRQRRNRLLSNNNNQQHDEQVVEDFLAEEMEKKKERDILKLVYSSSPIAQREEEQKLKPLQSVEDFASRRANLFRKLRAIHDTRNAQQRQHSENENLILLEQIESMVNGGFAGSRVDVAFEEEVNHRVNAVSEERREKQQQRDSSSVALVKLD